MESQRLDLGRDRWMAIEDGRFLYVCRNGRHRLDIATAPVEVMGRGPIAEEPLLASIGSRIEVALMLLLGFTLGGFAIQLVAWQIGNARFPWVLALAIVSAVIVLWRMFRPGSRLVTRGTRIHWTTDAESSLFVPHRQQECPELEGILAQLPERVPLSNMTRFSFRSPLGRIAAHSKLPGVMFGLIVGAWAVVGWNHFPLAPFGIAVFWSIPMICHAIDAVTMPRQLREASSALIDGDLESALLLLGHVLNASPLRWYANYCQVGLSILTGDFRMAASSVRKVKRSRFATVLNGSYPVLPQDWELEGQAKLLDQLRIGTLDAQTASRIWGKAYMDYAQPAH